MGNPVHEHTFRQIKATTASSRTVEATMDRRDDSQGDICRKGQSAGQLGLQDLMPELKPQARSATLRRQPRQQSLMMVPLLMIALCLQLVSQHGAEAFTLLPAVHSNRFLSIAPLPATGGGSKKKRRKRKTAASPEPSPTTTSKKPDVPDLVSVDQDDNDSDEVVDINMINEVANFRFEPKNNEAVSTADEETSASPGNRGTAIPLPDIKEARKKKQLEEELVKKEEEDEANKVRIKRSDKEAFRKLLEQQPFADADDSLFVEEDYGAVSALLGERAKPFLGIPLGPLQVGHFIGALGIILMAFVEYPGFPLTNLPTPLRSCFQGGLATIFAVNAVLAGFVAIKAPERGQPIALWIPKTFAVGGLAFDQLMQLPTLEEIEKAKAVKGRRALKNKKK